MPRDGGHSEAMWLLPFAAAACGRDQSLVSVVLLGVTRDRLGVTCGDKAGRIRGSRHFRARTGALPVTLAFSCRSFHCHSVWSSVGAMFLGALASWLSASLVDYLYSVYRGKAALAMTVLGFSAVGVGLIIGSYFVPTWWQALLLAIGTSLLVVGTVEVGILGVLKKIIDPDEGPSEMVNVLDAWLNRPEVSRGLQLRMTGMNPAEVAVVLRDLANNLDTSAADGGSESGIL
jgi:hypothetical protein